MKRSRKIKKPGSTPKLMLEEIIGLTTKNANGLASSVLNSKCAYIAGCVVVVYDIELCTQSHLMVSHRMPKPLSCVAVSPNANSFAAGESGHQGAILMWKGANPTFLCELKGHQYGVACMAFSPDGKHLASVGYSSDGYIFLWDLQTQMLLTKIKACSSCSAVASISFSLDAKFILTAGIKHLKLWTVELFTRSRLDSRATSIAIHGKHANVGYHKGYSFVAITSPSWTEKRHGDPNIACKSSPIHALTDTGILCLLNFGLAITHSVDLKVKKGLALSTSSKLVACACNNGIVKLFTISSLKYAGILHFSSPKRRNKATTTDCQANMNHNKIQPLPTLPDAIACQFSTSEKLVVIYEDRSLNIWNLLDVNKATRCCVLVSHSACIWDITNLPCENMHDPSLACVAKGCPGGVSFATCSADGSIRSWDLALQPILSEDKISLGKPETRVLGGTKYLVSAGIFERDSVASGVLSTGFRSLAVSSDGKFLAAGDCQGNIHVFDLHTSNYLCIQDAHDAEILSLSFSFTSNKTVVSDKVAEDHYFLASAGQDRMVHVYDVERNFDLIGSVFDHPDAVTSVKFACNGCKIVSCRSDRSLVLHDLAMTDTEYKISQGHQIASHGTAYEINLYPVNEVAVVVGEDKKINAFDIASGKLVKSIRYDEDLGNAIKVTMDPSGTYVVCCYSNGSICIYDYVTGEMVAQAAGHVGAVTGVIYLPDCKHLASVGNDGCIFVWKVPGILSTRMVQRMEETSCQLALESIALPAASCHFKFTQGDDHQYEFYPGHLSVKENLEQVTRKHLYQEKGSVETSEFQFSISRLPKWAQAKVTTASSHNVDGNYGSFKQGGQQNSSSSINCVMYNASACPGSRSPPRSDSKCSKQFSWSMSRNSSDSDLSPGPPLHRQNYSFALDNRWSTVHTVYFDLLNSPEGLEMKDQTMPLASLSNLSEDKPMEMTNNIKSSKLSTANPFVKHPDTEEEKISLCKYTSSDNSGTISDDVSQSWVGKSRLSKEPVGNQMYAKLQSAAPERELAITVDAGASNMDLHHNYLSNLNFSSFSAEHSSEKLQAEGRKSSARKSQFGRFVVRMDLGDEKKCRNEVVRESSGEARRGTKEPDLKDILEDTSMQLLEVSCRADTGIKDAKNIPVDLLSPSCNIYSAAFERHQEMYTECQKALVNLDVEADRALELFSQFMNLNSREVSKGPETQLSTEATERLLLIANKVNAITRLVQSGAISLEKNGLRDV